MTFNENRFKEIISQYHRKRRPDPFIEWFKSVKGTASCGTPMQEVMLVLINARFDQATKAENAVENTKRLYAANVLDSEKIAEEKVPSLIPVGDESPESWRSKYIIAHGSIYRASLNIVKQKRWDAGNLLKYLSSPGIKVPYLGTKTSRLAVRWLSELIENIKIDMSTYSIPVDRNIYRVSSRLGIIDPHRDFYYPGYEEAGLTIKSKRLRGRCFQIIQV